MYKVCVRTLHCGYATATGKVLQATPDHSEMIKRFGSQVAALQEFLYGNLDLPNGAVAHLLGLPKEQRGVLDHLLKEFKGVFPAELPKYLPPDRTCMSFQSSLAQSLLPGRCIATVLRNSC